jgi:hypothetical protein
VIIITGRHTGEVDVRNASCILDPCMAVPWLSWLVTGLSLRRPGFMPGSVYVGFMDKVALGQVFSEFFSFIL